MKVSVEDYNHTNQLTAPPFLIRNQKVVKTAGILSPVNLEGKLGLDDFYLSLIADGIEVSPWVAFKLFIRFGPKIKLNSRSKDCQLDLSNYSNFNFREFYSQFEAFHLYFKESLAIQFQRDVCHFMFSFELIPDGSTVVHPQSSSEEPKNSVKIIINLENLKKLSSDLIYIALMHELIHLMVQGSRTKSEMKDMVDKHSSMSMVLFDVNADSLVLKFYLDQNLFNFEQYLEILYNNLGAFRDEYLPQIRNPHLVRDLSSLLTCARIFDGDFSQYYVDPVRVINTNNLIIIRFNGNNSKFPITTESLQIQMNIAKWKIIDSIGEYSIGLKPTTFREYYKNVIDFLNLIKPALTQTQVEAD